MVVGEVTAGQQEGAGQEEGPAKQEPTKQEPTKQEPEKHEPTKQEPTKQEPTKQEPTKQEPTSKSQLSRSQLSRSQLSKSQLSRTELGSNGSDSGSGNALMKSNISQDDLKDVAPCTSGMASRPARDCDEIALPIPRKSGVASVKLEQECICNGKKCLNNAVQRE